MDELTSAPDLGTDMHRLLTRLFPICRSITGEGLRETLSILAEHVPLAVHEVPSGTHCFDWTVPDEWTVRDAYVADADGNRIIDFRANNLHLMSYSEPFEGRMGLAELAPHLHTLPEQPDAIPYVTSYYRRDWGFCLTHRQFEALTDGEYAVRVDTGLAPGAMSYGELLIPGETDEEVLLATNICHPSMANNELSGPVLLTYLARWLIDRGPRYSYRVLFLPETIGALAYLGRHLDHLKRHVVAGFQVVCVGGPGPVTYIESRNGGTLADRVARHVLEHSGEAFQWLDHTRRASDERQWCSPGADLPVGVLMRTSFHAYPEYHTSLDDTAFVRADQLAASLALYQRCLEAIEGNRRYRATVGAGEPQLGKRDLYPATGGRSHEDADANTLLALLGYADGETDLLEIAGKHGRPIWDYYAAADTLVRHGLIAA